MAETKTTSRERTNFSKIRTAIQIPNLIEVQKKSYERFLQMNMLPEEREDTGLQAVFNSVFPISVYKISSLLPFFLTFFLLCFYATERKSHTYT